MKRVFNVDVETCHACGGALRIIACIKDPEVIEKILNHLNEKSACLDTHRFPETRPRRTRARWTFERQRPTG